MTNLKNKTKLSTITLILVLTASVMLVALPPANAQGTMETYAFIGAIPNPIGKGQEVLLHIGITDRLSYVEQGWEGLWVTIKKPDETTDTIENIRTDATGGTARVYVPDMVGIYTLQSHFPEQATTETKLAADIPLGTVMLASESDVLELVVQEEALPIFPGHEFFEEYWTRPVDAQLREWASILGSSLKGNSKYSTGEYFPGNEEAPETPHILWARELERGGLAGGELGPHAFEEGDAYEGRFDGSVIVSGILFYNRYWAGNPTQEVVAVDIHTGEELWAKPLVGPDGDVHRVEFGQTFFFDSFNYHGVFDYLWATDDRGGTWHAFDPNNGEWVYSMENVVPPGMTYRLENLVYGDKGEIYQYFIDPADNWMALWSSSRVVTNRKPDADQGSWIAEDMGTTLDGTKGIEWNVTIPEGMPGGEKHSLRHKGGADRILEDRIIVSNCHKTAPRDGSEPVRIWGLSIEPESRGELLFETTWNPPLLNLTIGLASASVEDGVFVLAVKETRQFWGFNITTGENLWGPTESEHYLQLYEISYGRDQMTPIFEGKLYSATMAGIVYCYNVTTGKHLWTYEVYDPYNEILWSNNWPVTFNIIADGKIYLGHTEHSPLDPKPRGAPYLCLNATTGEVIWRANGLFRETDWGGRSIIGDSIIATMDTYDQRIYAIGKGPSSTTVSIQNDVISHGSSVMIMGTVMDVSPGTEDTALQLRFSNGVPAVSDESMTDWMLYVYKQFECPADVEGVKVFLKILDPNGEWYSATVTTDRNGRFSHMWAPSIVGEYKVTAMFEGSESYYPSEETTVFGVDPETTTEYPYVPSAEEIADTTVSKLPAYPDVPTAEEIAADSAQRTINMLPQYPDTTCPEIPAYLTIDLVIIAAVAIAIIIGIVSYLALKKQK